MRKVIRRIIYIFDRLTNKYRYDIDILKEYLYFCYKIKSSKNYFKAITRALELNPACLRNHYYLSISVSRVKFSLRDLDDGRLLPV